DSQQGRLIVHGLAGYGSTTIWPEDYWRRLGGQPLIVLDEIGAREAISDHHYDCLHRLLEARKGRPLVAISNLEPERIERLYDARIFSRLASGTVICLAGKDRRLDGETQSLTKAERQHGTDDAGLRMTQAERAEKS